MCFLQGRLLFGRQTKGQQQKQHATRPTPSAPSAPKASEELRRQREERLAARQLEREAGKAKPASKARVLGGAGGATRWADGGDILLGLFKKPGGGGVGSCCGLEVFATLELCRPPPNTAPNVEGVFRGSSGGCDCGGGGLVVFEPGAD